MGISLVQSTMAASSGAVTSQTITLSQGVTAGNLLVATVSTGNASISVTPPSGWSAGPFNQPGGSANCESGIWYALVGSGGVSAGTTSFTFTLSAQHNCYIDLSEWSSSTGWPSSPLDQSAVGNTSGSTGTALTSGTTGTTAQASELWLASFTYDGAAQTESGLTSGWTRDHEVTDSSNNHTALMCYRVASATGTASCGFSIGTAQYWAAAIATFKTAAATNPVLATSPTTMSFSV